MKYKIALLFLTLTLVFSAQAGGRTRSSSAIAISCGICDVNEQITFSGSGFKQGSTIYLVVDGTTSRTLTVVIDSKGGFSIVFAPSASFDLGPYTVDAYTMSGKTSSLVATTAFTVQ